MAPRFRRTSRKGYSAGKALCEVSDRKNGGRAKTFRLGQIVGELKHWPLGEELTFLLCSGYEERARSSSRVALGSPSDKATAGARRLEDTRCFHGWMIAR